jgi:hypothetical protein
MSTAKTAPVTKEFIAYRGCPFGVAENAFLAVTADSVCGNHRCSSGPYDASGAHVEPAAGGL